VVGKLPTLICAHVLHFGQEAQGWYVKVVCHTQAASCRFVFFISGKAPAESLCNTPTWANEEKGCGVLTFYPHQPVSHQTNLESLLYFSIRPFLTDAEYEKNNTITSKKHKERRDGFRSKPKPHHYHKPKRWECDGQL